MEQENLYPVDLPEGLDESHHCSSCSGVEGHGAGEVVDRTELQDLTTDATVALYGEEKDYDSDSDSNDGTGTVSLEATRSATIAISFVDDDMSVQNVLEALIIAQRSGGRALVAIPRNRICEILKVLKGLLVSSSRKVVSSITCSNYVLKHQKLKRSKSFP